MTKSIFERYIKKFLNFINKGNGIAHFFSAVFVACKTIWTTEYFEGQGLADWPYIWDPWFLLKISRGDKVFGQKV